MLGAKIHILLASQISNHNHEDTFPHKMNIEVHKRENKFLFQERKEGSEKYSKGRAILPLSRFQKKLGSEKKEFIAFSFYSCHRVTNKSLLVQ